MGRYTQAMYQELNMPVAPHPDYIELGTFRPADSLELIKIAADIRIKNLHDIIGVGITHYANQRAMQDKLFHTWADFSSQQKQFDTPTRSQDVDFGRSLHGFPINREGYLQYLKLRAPDLHEFLMKPMAARIPIKAFKMHAWVLGMTGAGKSETVKILAHLLKQPANATTIILDPERKLGEEIAHSKEFVTGDNLIYIDPALGRNKKLYPILNPLEYPSDDLDEQATYAEVFVDAMREAIKGEITERMETLLTNCTRVLLRRSGSTILDLQRFMDKTRNGDLVQAGQSHPDPLVREFFSHSFLQSDWTKTKDPLAAKIQVLLSRPAFANCVMGQSTIHMEQIIESKKTVVLVLDEAELGTLGSKMLGTFFVAMLESTIRRMRSGSREQNNPDPVYLIPDEFQRFVTPRFGQILTRARRLGLHLIAAQQYVGQDGMSKDLTENMEINTFVKIVGLYTSQKHAKTAAEKAGVHADDLALLGNGKYAVKAGQQPPVIVQFDSSRLGHSNSMTAAEWNAVKVIQLDEYYRPVGSFDSVHEDARPTPPEAPAEPKQKPSQEAASTPADVPAPTPQPKPQEPSKKTRKPRFRDDD